MGNSKLNFGIFLTFCHLIVSLTTAGEVPRVSRNEKCLPTPSAAATQYLIGYGSLMKQATNTEIQDNSGDSPAIGEIFPVEIRGFQRAWNAKFDHGPSSQVFLGVVPDQNSTFNGVIFQLFNNSAKNWSNAEVLGMYDDREEIYCRVKLETENFLILGKNVPVLTRGPGNDSGSYEIWIYVTKPDCLHQPSKKFPIWQSYVDTFLSGCFELEEKFGLENFAQQCVESTGGWNPFLINDRNFPNRSSLSPSAYGKIDRLFGRI